jgi:hypothetical protein
VFGVVVHGMLAVFLMTAITLVSGIAAWLIYKRDFLGWASVITSKPASHDHFKTGQWA